MGEVQIYSAVREQTEIYKNSQLMLHFRKDRMDTLYYGEQFHVASLRESGYEIVSAAFRNCS